MTPEDVLFKLGQLEPDEIARLMKDSGIQALRCYSTACAVTQYVYNETRLRGISTGYVTLGYQSELGEVKIAILPDTVTAFVGKFDGGEYPELDQNSPENM